MRKVLKIFRNGVMFHGRHAAGFRTCSTMVIKNDVIEYLGDDLDNDMPDLKNWQVDQEIDLQGRTVWPSFIDAHMHLLQFGASLLKVGLDSCKNLEEIRATIGHAAQKAPNAKRILCRGWRQFSTNRQALASMIDDLDDRPIFIDSDDLHSEWCNSAALREMGIDKHFPDPADGTIHRDKDGNPTGLISEGAVITLIWPYLLGASSKAEKLDMIRAAIREYHASGYTGVIEMAMDQGAWELLEYLRKHERLELRVAAHWFIVPTGDSAANLAQVQTAISLHKKYNLQNSPNFRIAGIKLILDGVVDSCTAALSEPYLVPPYTKGDLNWTDTLLHEVIHAADAAHLQVACHAIGDRAINQAIDALASLQTTGRRHRIEHLEMTHPDDAKRLGGLGITASVQPVHSDPSILESWPELVGEERIGWSFAYRDFHDHGAQVSVSTDSPTAPHRPFPNLYVASTRRSAREPGDPRQTNPRGRLEMCTAFDAASWGGAYSCFVEDRVGSLEVGKKADFVVVDGLGKVFEPKALLDAVVVETWFDGEKIYTQS